MKNKFDLILLVVLSLLGILTRTVFHIAPNVEFVTLSSLAAGYFFMNKKFSVSVPFIIMAVTDIIIGNTSIFIFTWSGFIFSSILGIAFSSKKIKNLLPTNSSVINSSIVGFGGSIVSVLFFYLWTNFGVVVTSAMYPDTMQGLINSYINALPFLKNQLVGNMFFAPFIFSIIALAKDYYLQRFNKRNILEHVN